MGQFGDLYSQYYDLLYSDKDYAGEVEYIDSFIKKYNNNAKNILDLGCGTGKHDQLFVDKGYSVHGVDQSEKMLALAKNRVTKTNKKLTFIQSDIKKLKLNLKFDVVMSLFHVMSYQTSNKNLLQSFEVVKKHLNKDGIFIFDFWYGPAVLTDLPVTRVKRLEDESIKILRLAEPELHPQANIVDVNYNIFIEDKKTSKIIEKQERHKMRYFFDTELEIICKNIGFNVIEKRQWLSNKQPGFDSWNVVWVIKSK